MSSLIPKKVFENIDFNAFKDKTIKAIVVPNGAEQGRKFFDNKAEYAVNECEAKGLAWTKFEQDGTVQGGIAKFINEEAMEEKVCIGVRDNVESLAECYEMIEDFPLSPTSELTLVQLNRYNQFLKPTTLEVIFNVSVKALVDSDEKAIRAYEFN